MIWKPGHQRRANRSCSCTARRDSTEVSSTRTAESQIYTVAIPPNIGSFRPDEERTLRANIGAKHFLILSLSEATCIGATYLLLSLDFRFYSPKKNGFYRIIPDELRSNLYFHDAFPSTDILHCVSLQAPSCMTIRSKFIIVSNPTNLSTSKT